MCVLQELKKVVRIFRETGMVSIPVSSRPALVAVLEQAVTCPEQLAIYVGGLERIADVEEFGAADPLKPGELKAIMQRRWGDVSDKSIALLLLRPATIAALGEQVWRHCPSAWLSVVEQMEQFEVHTEETRLAVKEDRNQM